MNNDRPQGQPADAAQATAANSLAGAISAERIALAELLSRYRVFSRLRSILWHANDQCDHAAIAQNEPLFRAAESEFRRARRSMGEAMFSVRKAESALAIASF